MLHAIQINPAYSYVKKEDSLRMVSIAPAPEKYIAMDIKRCNSRSNGYVGAQAASIARRNARERNRVKQVNDGYNALRKRLPAAVVTALSGGSRRGSGKKLSKVDTLKMVVEYIRYLERIIEDNDTGFEVDNTVVKPQYENKSDFGYQNGVKGTSEMSKYDDDDEVFTRSNEATKTFETSQYEDEGVFAGRNSPYSDTVPSPIGSDSSGVYSAYSSSGCYQTKRLENQLSPMEEDELLDAISWWQEK